VPLHPVEGAHTSFLEPGAARIVIDL
jgi:hypothetical protein